MSFLMDAFRAPGGQIYIVMSDNWILFRVFVDDIACDMIGQYSEYLWVLATYNNNVYNLGCRPPCMDGTSKQDSVRVPFYVNLYMGQWPRGNGIKE